MTANGRDTSMSKYGEGTTFFACVMPYEGGYSVNIYSTFTKASGAFSAASFCRAFCTAISASRNCTCACW